MLLINLSFFFLSFFTEGPEHHRYTAEHDDTEHDRLPGQNLWTFWQNKVTSVLLDEYCVALVRTVTILENFQSEANSFWLWHKTACVAVSLVLSDRTKQKDLKRLVFFAAGVKSPLKNIPSSCHAKHLELTDGDKEDLLFSVFPSADAEFGLLFQRYGGISVGGVNSQVRLTDEEVQSVFTDLQKLFAAYQVRNCK